MIKGIWDYAWVLDTFILKGLTKTQNKNSQFKTKITKGSISRTSTDVEDRWNTKTLTFIFIATKNLNRSSYVYSYKALKSNLAFISINFSFILTFRLQSKNHIETMIYFHRLTILLKLKLKNQLEVTFLKYSSKFLAYIKNI